MKQAPASPSPLPTPPLYLDGDTRTYLTMLISSLARVLGRKLDVSVPVASVLLASPNGSVYTVKVADDGSLQTELLYDAS